MAQTNSSASPFKVVAGVTAILSLAFGLRQAFVYVSDYRERQRRITELLGVAEQQRSAREYRAAWRSLNEAAALQPSSDVVQRAREQAAMSWLDDASSASGLSLGAIGDTVAPVLNRGALAARGSRQADLMAHLGWANFLRWRDGQVQLDPATRYQQALATDPGNVFAHTMWGHWLLWSGPPQYADAERHFAAALASGRERPYVRGMSLAAYGNRNDSSGDLAMLRIANDMRVHAETVSALHRRKLWSVFYSLMRRNTVPLLPQYVAAAVSPVELVVTYRWLFGSGGYPEDDPVIYTLRLAQLEEAAGDTGRALVLYRSAQREATARHASVPALDDALRRLSVRPRAR